MAPENENYDRRMNNTVVWLKRNDTNVRDLVNNAIDEEEERRKEC